jgi:hypothetical protein
MLLYDFLCPQALKGKNKSHLSAFGALNRKTWVTKQVLQDWINTCFFQKTEWYLKSKNPAFKVRLVHDLGLTHSNTRAVYLPTNTTSLLQLVNHRITVPSKCYYTCSTIHDVLNVSQKKAFANVTWTLEEALT